MRQVQITDITKTVAELCIEANIVTDAKICSAIKMARDIETVPRTKAALDMLVENMTVAEIERMPTCQDTGMVVVFVEMGQEVHVVGGDMNEAIHEGVRQGYKEGYFRASVVNDPIERINTKDNTPAIIYYQVVPGDKFKITVMPKGFGSENKGAVKMLKPSDGIKGIEEFVIETVIKAGADACPPIIVGIGVGGTMDKAALMAKEALLLDLDHINPDDYWRGYEQKWLDDINALGIGTAGLRGVTTALGLKILSYPTHIAGLPVAVNIGCHVTRHKSAWL